MRESLYDKYIDEHGVVDFGRSGGMSQQKEAKRFLSALNRQSELQQKDCFTISVRLHAFMRFCNYSCSFSNSYSSNPLLFQEIYSLADRIGLRVPDIDTFVDNLNSVGYLLKKGAKTYQVLQPADNHRQPIWVTHKIPMLTTQTITPIKFFNVDDDFYVQQLLFNHDFCSGTIIVLFSESIVLKVKRLRLVQQFMPHRNLFIFLVKFVSEVKALAESKAKLY